MDSLVFENLNSSAIFSIKVTNIEVNIAYQSKKEKIYTYNCDNLQEFANNLQIVVKDPEKSVGSWVNRQIKEKSLILNTIWRYHLLMAKTNKNYDKFTDNNYDKELYGYEVKNIRRQSKKKVRKFKDYDEYESWSKCLG